MVSRSGGYRPYVVYGRGRSTVGVVNGTDRMFFGRDGAGFPEVFPQGLPALGWAARRIPVMHAISKDSLFY